MELPLVTLLAIIVARIEEEDKNELWRAYMANIIPMWGGKECKTYADVRESYEESKKPQQAPDTAEAYSNAKRCAEAFERCRG